MFYNENQWTQSQILCGFPKFYFLGEPCFETYVLIYRQTDTSSLLYMLKNRQKKYPLSKSVLDKHPQTAFQDILWFKL